MQLSMKFSMQILLRCVDQRLFCSRFHSSIWFLSKIEMQVLLSIQLTTAEFSDTGFHQYPVCDK